MKKVTKYQGKKVIVLGLARSGMSAAKLLSRLGAFVTVNDITPIEENKEAQQLQDEGIQVITGHHPIELLDEGFDYMVKNPGIPYENPMVAKALEKEIPILTEVELASDISLVPIVGITGTNGKTTVTMMLGNVLNTYKENLGVLAGNIGFPSSTVAQNVTEGQQLILELSSFQLMGTQDFHPHIAAITNLCEAHLDYHHTRKAYIEAKWEIQKNMTASDYLVLNIDQEETRQLANTTRATVISISMEDTSATAYCDGKGLYYQGRKIMEADEIGVPGIHNIQNALMVIAIAKQLSIPEEAIKRGIETFNGAKHRLEFVDQLNGVRYYNDSKATNALATKSALSGFEMARLILLLGGLDRGEEGELVIEDLQGIKGVATFGQTAQKMADLAKKANIPNVASFETLEEATKQASCWAEQGDSILLSPAHASWDQYKTFEQRGEAYLQIINEMKG